MDRFGTRSLDEVLAVLAVPGTDPGAVAEYVDGALVLRTKHRRVLAVGAAVLIALLGVGVLSLGGSDNPDEVVAGSPDEATDARSHPVSEDPTTTTSATTTAPSTVAGTVSPASGALSRSGSRSRGSSGSGAPGVAPVVPAAPTSDTAPTDSTAGQASDTTLAPPTTVDQPLVATAPLSVGAAGAGELVTVTVKWSDPDLPSDAKASARLVAGAVAATSAPISGKGACTGGTGASGKVVAYARFAAPGTYDAAVEVTTCAGAPVSFPVTVTVSEAAFNGGPGRVLTAQVPPGVDPEVGRWSFTPDGGTEVPLPPRSPGLAMVLDDLPSTLVVLAPDGKGTLSFAQDGGSTCSKHFDIASIANGSPLNLTDAC